MTIEYIGSWASVIALLAMGGTGIFKLYKFLKKKLNDINQLQNESEELASNIVSCGTNTEKRSDISLFVLLKAGDFWSRQRRSEIIYLANGVIILWFFSVTSIVNKFFIVEYTHPVVILLLAIIVLWFITLLLWAFFDYKIRKIENRWQLGVHNTLKGKIHNHIV